MREFENKTNIKDRKIRKRIFTTTLIIGIGVASYFGFKYDNEHLSIDEIEREINVHSGHEVMVDGTITNPKLDHGCEFPGDGAFEDRMADKMREQGYHEATIEAAVEKFELQYDDEMELANKIDLKQIEKDAKKIKTR